MAANQGLATESAGLWEGEACELRIMGLKCGMPHYGDKEVELKEAGGKVRLYVTASLAAGAQVPLADGPAHYLIHVMRAKAGDRVALFNGRDGEWLAEIKQAAKRGVILTCLTQTRPQTQTPDIWLLFAPVKKTPSDYLVQKATELGASRLQPVFTRRTIVTRVNEERLVANAIEAAEQSERLSVPEIGTPLALEKALAAWPKDRTLYFCDEGGDARSIAEALRTIPPPPAGGGKTVVRSATVLGEGDGDETLPRANAARSHAPSREGRGEAILTGPEGGFDPKERAMLRALPFVVPVTLGPRILRADTAALAALTIWQALAGDFR